VTNIEMSSEEVFDNVALRKIIREWSALTHEQLMREHRLKILTEAATENPDTGALREDGDGKPLDPAPPVLKRQRSEERASEAICKWLHESAEIRQSDAEKLAITFTVTYGCESERDVGDLIAGAGAAWESGEVYSEIKPMHRIKIRRALAHEA